MDKHEAEDPTHVQLQPRRSPQQSRAKDTVAKILDATAELLDEVGHTELNTNRVAELSGVNIATLYSYFPNKLALLHALAERFAEQQHEKLDAIYAKRTETDWRDTVNKLLDAVLDFNRTVKGAVALSLAMRSYHSLRQFDYDRDMRESALLASVLAELGFKGSPQELQIKALVLAETITAMVDYALEFYPAGADEAMEEVKLMVKLYIEHHLRQSSGDPYYSDNPD